MAKTEFHLPPDIIRAIEESLSTSGKVIVKMSRRTIKVQRDTVTSVLEVEI